MTMPILLLQKLHRSSKAKEHRICLQRRMEAWKSDNIDVLIQEGHTIQQHLPTPSNTTSTGDKLTRAFTKLVFKGKIKAALRLLSNFDDSCRVLPLDVKAGGEKPQCGICRRRSTQNAKHHTQTHCCQKTPEPTLTPTQYYLSS